MKSILISIHPEWVAKIANGIKSIEIRRSAPKDWMDYLSGKTKVEPKPRTAFIYCTKGEPLTRLGTLWNGDRKTDVFSLSYPPNATYNGKVVAKFRLDEIYKYQIEDEHTWKDPSFEETTQKLMGMGLEELHNYVGNKTFYGWHISDLVIFDEPKPLADFKGGKIFGDKPPQSWKYVEVEE